MVGGEIMPLYEYFCEACGNRTTKIVPYEQSDMVTCPECGAKMTRQFPTPARIVINEKVQRQYGTGSEGKLILGKETGGLDIFVPSYGSMEQEEVDYVAGMAVEKEKERVRKGRHNETKEALEGLKKLAYQTKPGKRYEALQEAVKDTGLDGRIKLAGG